MKNIDLEKMRTSWNQEVQFEKSDISSDQFNDNIKGQTNLIVQHFLNETKYAMFFSLALPVIGLMIVFMYGISVASLLLTALYVGLTVIICIYARKKIIELSAININDSVHQYLKSLQSQIKGHDNIGKLIGPIFGVLILASSLILANISNHGTLTIDRQFLVEVCSSSLLFAVFTVVVFKMQNNRYIKPIANVIHQLAENEEPSEIKKPKINLALIIGLVLIINIILFIALSLG